MKRLRTVNEAYAEILKEDKNTAITPYRIRVLCKANKVKNIPNGNRILIDLDDLLEKINSLDIVI